MEQLLVRCLRSLRKFISERFQPTEPPVSPADGTPPSGGAPPGRNTKGSVDGGVQFGIQLVRDTSWDALDVPPERIDPNLRLVVSLLEALDAEQLYRRTGVVIDENGMLSEQHLPLFLEFDFGSDAPQLLGSLLESRADEDIGLRMPRAFLNELAINKSIRVVTAELKLDNETLSPINARKYAGELRAKLTKIINTPGIKRVCMPAPLQPSLEQSLSDIGLPVDRQVKCTTVDGTDIVIGIIDDGCALAHRNFLVPGTTCTRIQYLWDQARTDPTGGWTPPRGADGLPDFLRGRELDKKAIDQAINQPGHVNGGVIDEDAVYDYLRYELDVATHGTHVMDIAAGNGASLLGTEGVASNADIIFVQLPRGLVGRGGPLLEQRILEGVLYVFARAAMLGAKRGLPGPVPAVINISYGGYTGAHDGTSLLASGIDYLLDPQVTGRSVVVAAGNGFEADCHAMPKEPLPKDATSTLRWILSPEDPTANVLEVWYKSTARFRLSLTPPEGGAALTPGTVLGDSQVIERQSDHSVAGFINHVGTIPGANLNVIRIWLGPTVGEDGSAMKGGPPPPLPPLRLASSASGVWTVALTNIGTAPATFHAWIERDDLGRRRAPRRQQSRFHPIDADPRFTLADLATGKRTLCVGAYNTATDEACRYSASGPTRDGRLKPEVCAPAEEDPAGRGILCASARGAQPTRMNGTSASAPHVAGLVALMFQFNRDRGGAALTADAIRSMIVRGAKNASTLSPPPPRKLRVNRHQEADAGRPDGNRQSDDFAKVTGAGKINVLETLLKLLP